MKIRKTFVKPLIFLFFGLVLSLAAAVACSSNPTPALQVPVPTATTAPVPGQPTATPAPKTTSTPTQAAMEQPRRGGILKVALNMNLKGLDNAFETSTTYLSVRHALYNSIVDVDEDLKVVPDLAQSWDISSDGKKVTFHLVKGAKFLDGADFNAQAVKWNIDRLLDTKVGSPHGRDLAAFLDSVSVQDDSTVVFNLKNAYRPFLANIYEYAGDINSPTAVQKYNSYANRNGEYSRNPAGTGAFKFVEWVPDNRLIVARNDNYFEAGKPYLDSVIYQHVPDATVQLAMVRTGETDLLGFVDAKSIPLVNNNPALKVVSIPRSRTHFIGISTDVDPWSNKSLRAALAYAVDRDAIVKSYFVGQAQPAYSFISVGWGYNPNIKVYDYNIQKAKEKLVEAGYPNGVTLPYWCSSTTADLELCQIIQAQMKDANINLEIKQVLPADFWSSIVNRKTHFANRWRGARADSGRYMDQVFLSKGNGNVMGYNNPEVDKLLGEAALVYDLAKAKAIYDQAQRLVAEDVYGVLLVYTKEFYVLNKNVQNFVLIPDLYPRVTDLYFSK